MPPKMAPPGKPASNKMRAKIAALKESNPEFIERMRGDVTQESKFFDRGAPGTVARHTRTRANFRLFCEETLDLTEETDMYELDTIIERTCSFIETMALLAEGRLAQKVKAGTLYQLRQAMEWWIVAYIPEFHTIREKFFTLVNRHIHLLAFKESLSVETRAKNNLGEQELELFYNYIMEQKRRVNSFKQHYVGWVISFITAARPGSFTVTQGYNKGAPIGGSISAQLPPRKESHTLRWKDIEFRRMNNGKIACLLTFRFSKGHQDPHKRTYVHARRQFFFAPKQNNIHLDLSALLFALAYERGLFTKTLDELLTGNELMIAIKPEIAEQAVMVGADTRGNITPSVDMQYSSLNLKLQEVCRAVGLFEYNSMYAFRREAASTTKWRHGLRAAQELLNHQPGSEISYANYDPKGMAGLDITAFRLGGEEFSTDEIRRCFAQSAQRITPRITETGLNSESGPVRSIQQDLEDNVRESLRNNAELDGLEVELQTHLMDIHEALQNASHLAQDSHYGYAAGNVGKYRGLLRQHGMTEHVQRLDKFLAHRKTRRQLVRKKARQEMQDEMKKRHLESLTIQRKEASKRGIPETSYEPMPELGEEEGYDPGDTEVDEERTAATDLEPAEYAEIPEGNVIVISNGEDDEDGADDSPHTDNWTPFVRQWINKRESNFKTSGLRCRLCAMDPSMPQTAKDKLWIAAKLNIHMKGEEHSREASLRRAFKLYAASKLDGKVDCPLCRGLAFKTQKRFMQHLRKHHPTAMWTTAADLGYSDEDGLGGESLGSFESATSSITSASSINAASNAGGAGGEFQE